MGFPQSAINSSAHINPVSLGDKRLSNQNSRPLAETQTYTTQNNSSMGSKAIVIATDTMGQPLDTASLNNQGARFTSYNEAEYRSKAWVCN